jgi:HAD superfamily hydrolase (TIGR01549 family)
MIKALIFDLDGTLVQTEILKAQPYANAVNVLTKGVVPEDKVIVGFKKYVGLSRKEVAKGLVDEFQSELNKNYSGSNLEDMQTQLLSKRLEIYEDMLKDPDILTHYFCPHNLDLLNSAYSDDYLTGLATMSHCAHVQRVLDVMNIKDKFKYVISREDVNNGKPDPEIYLKMKDKLNVRPENCIVIEDSVNGIKAALNANMNVFAVTNSITRESVHRAKLLDKRFIIDYRAELKAMVYDFIEEHKK